MEHILLCALYAALLCQPAGEAAAAPEDTGVPATAPAVPDNLTGRGLLDLPDPFPLAVLHLQLPVNTLEVLEEGQGRIEPHFNWANNYGLEDEFTIDAETYRYELGGWYALRSDFYLGAALPLLARDGGVLDSVVDGFHDAFGLTDGRRSLRPRNGYEIAIQDEDGGVHRLDRGAGLGDLVLKLHWNVHPGDRWFPAVAIEGLSSLPTSTAGFGSSGADFGMTVSFSKTFLRDLHLYAVLGSTYLTDTRTEGIRYEKHGFQYTLGIEWSVIRSFSLVFQAAGFSPLLRSPSPLNRSRSYVAFGLKWEFLKGMALELSAIENLVPPFESSADIALSTGFSFTL
ncbi:MAG: DUF3187 family protein [Planctomycetes bacterium]|nr:DUF3187 family protein [Planctomycetota bacterium]